MKLATLLRLWNHGTLVLSFGEPSALELSFGEPSALELSFGEPSALELSFGEPSALELWNQYLIPFHLIYFFVNM
jgi:hypothetical protein